MPITIIVVGAGICGLTTAIALHSKGFHVTILERTSAVQNIGGPISIRPAAMRLLRSLGLSKVLESNSERAISAWSFRRYSNGKELLEMDMSKSSTDIFGDETLGFARQALHRTLLEEVEKRQIEVELGVKVVGVDDEAPAVKLEDGRVLKADLVIGADGISSTIREAILTPDPGRKNSILSAWMVKIPLSAVKKDPLLASYLTKAYYWLGPGRMAIGTLLEDADAFDLHFYIDKELGTPGMWDQKGNINEVREHFKDFDPVLFKFMDLVPSPDCYIWRISGLSPLPTWISKGGRVVIIGDAAHAMVPYVGQGASQGIEDGVVLAECLSRANIDADVDLSKLLHIFETIRKPRAEATAGYALARLKVNHAPDGPLQQARDERMKTMRNDYESSPEWNGAQVLEPPSVESPLVDPYLLAYNALAHANTVLNQKLAK